MAPNLHVWLQRLVATEGGTMEPGNHHTPPGGHNSLNADGVDRLVSDMRKPLSVVHASAQLLQRRIDQGQVTDPRDLLSRLAAIERSCKHIDARLQQLERDGR